MLALKIRLNLLVEKSKTHRFAAVTILSSKLRRIKQAAMLVVGRVD